MSKQATDKSEATDKSDNVVLVPQNLIDKVRNYQKQIEVNTVDMQKLAFEMGKAFVEIKVLYKSATKAFGPAMTVMFPSIDPDYRGSYIYMAEHEKAIKAWLKKTGKGSKLSSCRSIQRQHAASLKEPKPDEEKGENDPDKQEYDVEKKGLARLAADMLTISERMKSLVENQTAHLDKKINSTLDTIMLSIVSMKKVK